MSQACHRLRQQPTCTLGGQLPGWALFSLPRSELTQQELSRHKPSTWQQGTR